MCRGIEVISVSSDASIAVAVRLIDAVGERCRNGAAARIVDAGSRMGLTSFSPIRSCL